ncbi:type IV pilus biogenesis protein PilM [Acetivibrio straminisolvens JCM 21531]|uniref:Type IV pilus biogenesis protein PilM n=1 Tax=Acetivibrio straminisolvens JCM 21531 TaxID=1294263 RepID=W4V1R8_9FIRM|nr:hypothetical protein [Acetivibrio straminisolvens]GAE87047.1 type IV pilus biogenesis protein PilM [Acetivibrio straminisolvens JCM 21531]
MLLPFLRNNYLSIDVGFRNIKVVEVAVNRNNEVISTILELLLLL